MARPYLARSAREGIPAVSLRRLLPEADFPALRDLVVSGCSDDSRRIEPGQVFVAIRGKGHDGHDFVAKALERGAAAAVVERHVPEAGRLQVVVPDAREAYSRICHAVVGQPSGDLPITCVAGSAEPTASSTFLRAILDAEGRRSGLSSRFGWSDGVRAYPSSPTEPDAPELALRLSLMVERRCDEAVLTIPGGHFAKKSAGGLAFSSLLVTGLGADADLRRNLARLARQVKAGGVVAVNADDHAADLIGAVNLGARRVSFGLNADADFAAIVEQQDLDGTRFRLRGLEREASVRIRPIGTSMVYAALGAAAIAGSRGIGAEAVVAGLESVGRVPCWPEPVAEALGRRVFSIHPLDPSLLEAALLDLGTLGQGPPVCVLAAGMDDPGAETFPAAERGAGRVVLTRMGARGAGLDLEPWLDRFRRPGRVRVVADRRKAIETALDSARTGQAVALIGAMPSDSDAIAGWIGRNQVEDSRRSA